MGQPAGILPLHIVVFLAGGGALFFGVRSWGIPLRQVPLRVVIYGVGSGLSQFLLVRVIDEALKMGPLSPVWCALSLSIIPTIVFASVFLGEKLGRMQVLAMVSGVLCVLAASGAQQQPAGEARALANTWLAYVGVLLLIPTFNCISQIAIKDMNHRPHRAGGRLIDHFNALFLMLMYLCLWLGAVAYLLATRNVNVPLMPTAGLGLLAAAGSISGMAALTACARLPAAILFTLSSVVSILATAIVSTSAFGEERSVCWFGTVGFAVLTVVLASASGSGRSADGEAGMRATSSPPPTGRPVAGGCAR